MITEQQLDQWLEDLRSGKFTQGRQRLCTIEADGKRSYCCLGVLATRVATLGGTANIVSDKPEMGQTQVFVFGETTDRHYVPHTLISQFYQGELTTANDEGKKTFLEIADYIEKNRRAIVDGYNPEEIDYINPA